jgi:hypothetical protein
MDDDAFGVLVAPIGTETFLREYLERDVLHVARDDPAHFAWLYDVGCVEDALALGAGAPGHFAMIKYDEAKLPAARLTGERNAPPGQPAGKPARFAQLDPRNVLAAFADGYTLTIEDAGAFRPALAQFCNRIEAQLGFFAQANAYFTPAHARGFDVHYDTHDTLIAQLEGTKDWTIYDPVVELPLALQPFAKQRHEGRLGNPRTVRLAPGDSLYLPRGFPHHAASAERRSLHLTFALSPTRVVDLLDALVRLAAFGDVELRRGLPPGWQRDPAFAARFSAKLGQVLPRALGPERIAPASELVGNDLLGATRTVAAGTFDALDALGALAPDARIALRDDAPFELRDRGERLDVVLATKVVALAGDARPAFALLAAGGTTFGEIARVLPGDHAAAFVRALTIEGLLRIDPAV